MAGLRAFDPEPVQTVTPVGTQITSDVGAPWPVSLVTRLIWNVHRLSH